MNRTIKRGFNNLTNKFRKSFRVKVKGKTKGGVSKTPHEITIEQIDDSDGQHLSDVTSQTEQDGKQFYVTECGLQNKSIEPIQLIASDINVGAVCCDSANDDLEGYTADAETSTHYVVEIPAKLSRSSVRKSCGRRRNKIRIQRRKSSRSSRSKPSEKTTIPVTSSKVRALGPARMNLREHTALSNVAVRDRIAQYEQRERKVRDTEELHKMEPHAARPKSMVKEYQADEQKKPPHDNKLLQTPMSNTITSERMKRFEQLRKQDCGTRPRYETKSHVERPKSLVIPNLIKEYETGEQRKQPHGDKLAPAISALTVYRNPIQLPAKNMRQQSMQNTSTFVEKPSHSKTQTPQSMHEPTQRFASTPAVVGRNRSNSLDLDNCFDGRSMSDNSKECPQRTIQRTWSQSSDSDVVQEPTKNFKQMSINTAEKAPLDSTNPINRDSSGFLPSSLTDSSGSESGESTNEPPVMPSKLDDELMGILKDAEVPYYSIGHDTADIHRIVIDGCKVTRLQDELNTFIQQKYGNFTIITNDIEMDSLEGSIPNHAFWMNLLKPPRRSLATRQSRYSDIKLLSVVELLLKGHDKTRERYLELDYFGSTTAHSIMNNEQIGQLSCSGDDFETVLNDINKEVRMCKHPFVHMPDHSPIDIRGRSFFCFRYWFHEDTYDDQSILSDFALFQLDKSQITANEWLPTPRDRSLSSQLPVDASEIKVVTGKQDIINLIGRRVVCAGKYGHIHPNEVVKQGMWVYGLRLCFVLDDDQMLQYGDCGSILYLLGNEADPKNYMIGMLFGNLRRDPRIHQAVILSHALRQVETIDESQIDHLSPLSLRSRLRPAYSVESGFETLTSSYDELSTVH